MANFEVIMSTVTTALDSLSEIAKKVKAVDRIVLSCIATGVVFLVFALIQIMIIITGSIHIEFGNVMLIVADLAVTGVAGFIAFHQGEKLNAKKNKQNSHKS